MVKQGAQLYQIEKGLFEAAVGQAEGALERSKAAKILSEVQLQRAEDLLAKNAGTAWRATRHGLPTSRLRAAS